jgi:MOSC domain-containing protein YiiM
MAATKVASLIIGRVVGVFAGGPKNLRDGQGEWRSSIARDPVSGPMRVETRGLAGDQATQSYHGGPDSAVCLHSESHYTFWNDNLGLSLAPGGVGENLTIAGVDDQSICDETMVCVGDILQIGSVQLQITAPRTPCDTQARRVGRADWIELTLRSLRTGMYARVLAPGSLQTGDDLRLAARPNPGLTVQALVRCYFHEFDPELARRLIAAEGLMPWWAERFERRLREALERQLRDEMENR